MTLSSDFLKVYKKPNVFADDASVYASMKKCKKH